MYELEALTPGELREIVRRGAAELGGELASEGERADRARAGGDARSALGNLELAAQTAAPARSRRARRGRSPQAAAPLRQDGEVHYDTISAWIKSTRASDVHASIYYLAVMLEGGEDARFIARRMVILASEDVGNADPHALLVAVAAAQAVEHVGLPEARLNLAQAAIYLAWRRSRTPPIAPLRLRPRTSASTACSPRLRRFARPPTRPPRSSGAARATSTPTTTRPASPSTACPSG